MTRMTVYPELRLHNSVVAPYADNEMIPYLSVPACRQTKLDKGVTDDPQG